MVYDDIVNYKLKSLSLLAVKTMAGEKNAFNSGI